MIGGIISLLWCLIVLVLSFSQTTPGTSLFPEIDFASKVTSEDKTLALAFRSALPAFLSGLSMAGTFEIKKALERVKFYVHMNLNVEDPVPGRSMRRSVIEIDDGRNYGVQGSEKNV